LNPKAEKKVQVKEKHEKPKPRKANPQRLQRLEREMEKLNQRRAAIEARLADPAVYQDQETVKALLQDQAYVAKELGAAEAEWLEWADSAP